MIRFEDEQNEGQSPHDLLCVGNVLVIYRIEMIRYEDEQNDVITVTIII